MGGRRATVTDTFASCPTYTSTAASAFAIGGQTSIGASPAYGTGRDAATSSDAEKRGAASSVAESAKMTVAGSSDGGAGG